jgi:hypothetical protein
MNFKRLFLLIICISLLAKGTSAQVFTVDTLVNNGNKYNRINLVFMGDGYTATQQTKFVSDVNGIVDKLFQTFPFTQYKQFFNVYAIHVISADSGASHPGTASDCNTEDPSVPISTASTYFSSSFDYGGVHRLLYCSYTNAINNVLQTNFPLYDKGLIIVNTPYYGGSAGTFPVCSVNNSSSEIMIHELGHAFAGLADEYGGSLCDGIEKPNCTQQTDTSQLKWKAWISSNEPIPTENNTLCNSIGLYMGANYCNTEWYRPKCNCKMNMLGQPFCEICSEAFIYNINNSVSLIDGYQPAVNSFTISTGQSQNCSAVFLMPNPNSLLINWKLDDSIVAVNVNSYIINSASLTSGMHLLMVTVSDTTCHSKTAMPLYTKTWVITNNVTAHVALNAFQPVCVSAPAFVLNEGTPAGGSYTGPGVSNGKFNPSFTGIGTFSIVYTLSGISSAQPITVNQTCETTATGVNTIDAASAEMNVYPNPSSGHFMVQASNKAGEDVEVSIVDVYGHEVMNKQYTATADKLSEAVDISTLPAGTYFVQVKKGDKVYNKKITKQ